MIFSVFIQVFLVTNWVSNITYILSHIFAVIGVGEELIYALLSGIVEITIGSQQAAMVEAPILQKLMITAFIIGWSGFSVHAQVAAMVHGTDISLMPYILARFLHGILACLFTIIVFPKIGPALEGVIHPVIAPALVQATLLSRPLLFLCILLLLVMIPTVLIVTLIIYNRFKLMIFKVKNH